MTQNRTRYLCLLLCLLVGLCQNSFAQTLTLQASPPPLTCVLDTTTCEGQVSFPIQLTATCDPAALQFTFNFDAFSDAVIDEQIPQEFALTGTYPDYTFLWSFPIGAHQLHVEVSDGCTSTSANIAFELVDCAIAFPEIHNGLAVELFTEGESTISNQVYGDTLLATHFVKTPYADCSNLRYSIHNRAEAANPDQAFLVLDCSYTGTSILKFFVWDDADNPYAVQPDGSLGGANYDSSEVYVLIVDEHYCPDYPINTVLLSGMVTKLDGTPIPDVSISLSGAIDDQVYTNVIGGYNFEFVPNNAATTLTPLLDRNHKNGVNTLDLLILLRHILGVAPIEDPYQLIAADVDRSGDISVSDIIELRRLILSIDTELRGNTSWRFLDANYTFSNPTNPWEDNFPELITYTPTVDSFSFEGNFIGIKIGDVNNDAIIE
ncbi:MAG: dockerin type I domain-containing protein [Bacteroidota bacterium]